MMWCAQKMSLNSTCENAESKMAADKKLGNILMTHEILERNEKIDCQMRQEVRNSKTLSENEIV